MVVSYSGRRSVTWESDKGGKVRGLAIVPFKEVRRHKQPLEYTANSFWKHLGALSGTMATSLLKTLAGKHQTSVRKEAKRLQGTAQTPEGPRTCLKLTIPREGKRPLVATFGGLSLKRVKRPVIKDQVLTPYPRMRSEIIDRLLHDTCEVCGSKEHIEMHHIRKLVDLNKEGRREKPLWMKIMISRKRKSMPLCRRCHDDIHANRPKSTRHGNRRAG